MVKHNLDSVKMRPRTNGGTVSGQAATRNVRSSGNTIGTTASNRSHSSVGQIKVVPASRLAGQKRSLPPKSEYEKFYEKVFLGNDEETVEEPDHREVTAATKRPLHALLNDEDSMAEVRRPSKIQAVRKTSEVLVSPRVAAKDEVIRQINGTPSPAKRPVPKVNNIHQKRHDRFDQLYNKTERHSWKDDAVQMLLQFWAQHIKALRGSMKNTIIYKEMEKQMSQFGPSHFEIKTKMDNMSRKYRVEADKFRKTGVPSKWPYFHKLQSLLIGTKAVDVFEEMMFDTNTGSSKYFEQEDSEGDELESLRSDLMAEELTANDHAFEEEADIKHKIEFDTNESLKESQRSPSPNIPEPDQEEEEGEEEQEEEEQLDEREDTPELDSTVDDHAKRKKATQSSHSDRMLEIEEEKLVIEREKLKVMKEALHELSSFHNDLMKMFKHKK